MKTICCVNMKGGVGKTTISVGLAYELATSFRKKVLLVDIDSQANSTLMILKEHELMEIDKNHKTIADLFNDGSSGLLGERSKIQMKDIIISNPWNIKDGYLDLIPSSIRLFEAKHRLVEMSYSEEFLKKHLNNLDNNMYDYCIIDSPPDFDKLVISALNSSDYYIIPLRPDYMSQQGLVVLENKIETIKDHINCKVLGLVISLIPTTRSEFHKNAIKQLEESYGDSILSKIKELQVYSKWPSLHSPLEKRKDREPFVELAKRVIERCDDN